MVAWRRREVMGAGIGLGSLGLVPFSAAAALKGVDVADVSLTAPSWPLFIAQEGGLFAAEGLDVKTTYVGSNPAVVQQVIAGSFAIGVTTYETLIRAVNAGAAIKMVASLSLKYPYSVIAKADIRVPADMRGKTVMLPFATSALTTFWNRWMAENGLRKGDVDLVYDGSTSNRFAALLSGTVAAAALTQPSDIVAEQKGYHKILDYGVYARNMGFTNLVATPTWLAKNSDTAKAYLRAVAKGVRTLYDTANRDRSIAVLTKAIKIDPVVAGSVYDYYVLGLKPFSPTLDLPNESVTGVLDELRASNAPAAVDHPVSRYQDRSFLPS